MVSEVIKHIQRYQKKPYNLKIIVPIHDSLLNYTMISEKECFEYSLQAEPRENYKQ